MACFDFRIKTSLLTPFIFIAFIQTIKLLEKFCQNDVIEEVRGKSRTFEDDNCIYRFVKEPGPFNFIEDVHMTSPRPVSPLGKHDRNHSPQVSSRKDIGRSLTVSDYDGTCFENKYAFQTCEEQENNPMSMVTSPSKKCCSNNLTTKKLPTCDANSQIRKLTPEQEATIWKEMTLARYLLRENVIHYIHMLTSRSECVCVWMYHTHLINMGLITFNKATYHSLDSNNPLIYNPPPPKVNPPLNLLL